MTSRHLSLEIAAAFVRGHPLKDGEAVPGCWCAKCTGVLNEAPNWTCRTSTHLRRIKVRERWEAQVDRARAIPILEVVRRLGAEPQKQGKEWIVSAPYREDRCPSLRINPDNGMWFDDPMGEGGDAIKLWMLTKRQTFAEAVRELAA